MWSSSDLTMNPKLEVFNDFEVNNMKNLPNSCLIVTAKFYEKCEHCKSQSTIRLAVSIFPRTGYSGSQFKTTGTLASLYDISN